MNSRITSRPLREHLDDILLWLKEEYDIDGGGFWCNKDIIINAYRNRQMFCMYLGGKVLSFLICSKLRTKASINLLVVNSGYRKKGIGSRLSEHVILTLRRAGVEHVYLECQPQTSALFWMSRGFINDPDYNEETLMTPRRTYHLCKCTS